MTGLLTAAMTATLADAWLFTILIIPGHAAEANPLVAAVPPTNALAARGALLVALAALTVVAQLVASRALRMTVGAALLIATAIGSIGAVSTIVAVIR